MKCIYCVLLLLCPYVSRAQHNTSQTKALGIGDKVPVLQLENIYDYPRKSIQWKPVKNKITIIHFLATYCSSCIEFTPKWHALQQRFGDSLQVILVTDEEKARLDRFVQKRPGYFGNIPLLFNNKSLKQLFPFEFISHLVWINGEGRVAAITGTAYATEKNIGTVLQGNMPGWPVKRDISNFNTGKTLLRINDNNIPYSSLPARTMHSAFASHMPDLPRGWYQTTDSAAGQLKISIINLPLVDVFRKLLNARALPPTQVLAAGTDPDHFFMDPARHLKAGWELQHTYCIEWLMPAGMSKEKQQAKMLADINFYFNTTAVLKDSIVNCLLLKDTLAYQRDAVSAASTCDSIALRNLVQQLNKVVGSMPVLEATNGRGEMLLPYEPALLNDIEALNKWLLPYGLVLTTEPRKIKLLLLTENAPNPFIQLPKLYLK